MKSKPIIIRVSSLSGYPDCPRRGAARLFRNIIIDAGYRLRTTRLGIGAIVGTALHKAAETCFTHKARHGELPTVERAIDTAAWQLDDGIGSGEVEYDGARGATHNRNEAQQQTIRMTSSYWHGVAPTVDPIMVETKLEAEVAPNVILSGTPDIICHEPGSVRDLKSGARLGNHSPQLGGYSLLARSHKIEINAASIDWVPRTPLNKPQPEPTSVSESIAHAETAAASILKHITTDLETFQHGDQERRIPPGDVWSFMANPSSMLCAEKYCPCWGVTGPHSFCHEWRPKE
jgi:hypothetical protein